MPTLAWLIEVSSDLSKSSVCNSKSIKIMFGRVAVGRICSVGGGAASRNLGRSISAATVTAMRGEGAGLLASRRDGASQSQVCYSLQSQSGFHSSSKACMGFDEFFDQKEKPGDEVVTGRAWTAADLRRKSFDDIHKLWFVLYKERNLLLSERERTRRNNRPVLAKEEDRYTKVKRSMGAIKFVLKERSKIKKMLEAEGVEELADTKTQN